MDDDLNTWKDIICYWIGRILLNGHTTQSNLQIKMQGLCDLSQITQDICHRTRTNNPKTYAEPEKIQNCQSKPEEKGQSWRHNSSRLQTILQAYSNQKSMVPAQKQTYRSVEQNREPRNKPPYLQLIHQQSRQAYTMQKRQSYQQVVLGHLDSHM